MKKMPVRTKNLKAPLGFFLFTDKIKKRENGSQYSVLPKFFANQKNILGSLQKIRSKLHGLLSRRNTASHRCSSLQGLRRSPSAFPFSGCSFRMLSEIFIDILLFFQFFHLLFHIFALHKPTHHTDTCRTRFSDRCRIFAADAADGINRNGYAFHNLLQKRQPSGGKSLLAIRHENVSCCDIGTAKPSRFLCFRNRMAGCADASELFLFFFLHAAQNMQGQMDLLRSQ